MGYTTSCARIAGKFGLYFLYRLGLCERPSWRNHAYASADFLALVCGWRKGLRIRGTEHCPQTGPAVFASNHMMLDDAWALWDVVYMATNRRIMPYIMMRDDFFRGWPRIPLIDFNELTAMGGAIHIQRERVGLSQLKPFIDLLRNGDTFMMFPNGTRTRTGMLFEYRDAFTEPGAVSFFLAQGQRKRPDVQVPAVPIVRTVNPAKKHAAYVIGPPLTLPHDAGRDAQRALDHALVARMGDLVEVNAAHLVCGLLYLRALHGGDAIEQGRLVEQVRTAAAAIPSETDGGAVRYVDPAVHTRLEAEVQTVLAYLAKKRIFARNGSQLRLDRAAVLAAPPSTTKYRKENPLKYVVNQIVHLRDVVHALEAGHIV